MSFCCLLLWFSEFFYPVLLYRRDLGSILVWELGLYAPCVDAIGFV
jgi:hypothetical protein